MSVSRRLARPMLSAIFIYGGLDAVRHPETKAGLAEPVALPLAQKIAGVPEDTETLVRINGAVQVGAGTMLALGRFRRLSALALIGSIIPTTYAGHRFWDEDDDKAKFQQQLQFLKNVGLAGGLILALVDTEGKPSIGWRARRAAKRAGQAVHLGREVSGVAAVASGTLASGARLAGTAQKVAVDNSRKARKAAAKGSRKAQKIAARTAAISAYQAQKAAAAGGRKAHEVAADSGRRAAKAARQASKQAAKYGAESGAKARKAGRKAAKEAVKRGAGAGAYLEVGADRAGELLSRAADRLPVG